MRAYSASLRSPIMIGLLSVLFVATATAQPVSNQPSPPAGASEEVVKLSPFEVTTEQDVGYLASNTLAGSRFNTSLKDTPASISVLTPEFLSDIGAFQLTDALNYAVNVEFNLDDDRSAINGNATFQDYQNYRVRGLPASVSRNYFTWFGRAVPDESAFIERIEDSRGPNAVLFGMGSPGGVINVNTKAAVTGRAFQKGSVSYGSYSSKRAALDFNQPVLGGKLAVRLNLVYDQNNNFRHWQFQEHRRALLSATYNLTQRTRLRAEFERGQLDSNEPRSFTLDNRFLKWDSLGRPTFATIPTSAVQTANGISRLSTATNTPRVTYISNGNMAIAMRGALITTGDVPEGLQTPGGGVIGSGVITDTSIADYSINVGGPAQTRSSRFSIISAFLEHQFTKNMFLELAFNHGDQSFDNRDPRQDAPNGLKGDPNVNFINGTPDPYAGQVYLETNWFRTVRTDWGNVGRATFTTEIDAKKLGDYRVAALAEYEKNFIGSTTYREFWVDSATGLPAFNIATPENAQNNVWRRSYPTEGEWRTYYISGPVKSGGLLSNLTDPVTGRTLSSAWLRQGAPSATYNTRESGMLVLQARYFDGRLIAAGGMRRDKIVESRLATWRDPANNLQSLAPQLPGASNSNKGRTKTYGLVYHVTPTKPAKVSLYYNWSDNLSLPARGQLILPPSGEPGDPQPPPPPRGKGEDLGIGVDLFDGKIYARATHYKTQSVDQSTTSPSLVRTINTEILDTLLAQGYITQAERDRRNLVGGHGLFDNSSSGWEVQITANPTKNWRFVFNYALADAIEDNRFNEWKAWDVLNVAFLSKFPINSIITNSGKTIAQDVAEYQGALREQTEANGISKLGNRRHKVSFVGRYNLEFGWLKGAYVGGTYRSQSKMFTGLDNTTGEPVYSNSYWRSDLFAGYTVRGLRDGRRLSFQLNVFNVFNQHDPLITRYSDDGSVFRNVVQPPTTWRFTTNFEL